MTIYSTLFLAATVVTASKEELRTTVNFAFGGATINGGSANDAFAVIDDGVKQLVDTFRNASLDAYGMPRQVDFAAATLNDVDEETDLFWVQGGTNDYIVGALELITQQAPAPPNPAIVAGGVGNILSRLYNEVGARRFLVPNLIPVGDAPLFGTFDPSGQLGVVFNQLTDGHNAALAAVVTQFEDEHDDARVLTVDANGLYQAFKEANKDTLDLVAPCNNGVPNPDVDLTLPGACDGFLYMDTVHTTSRQWQPVAEAATTTIEANFEGIERIITIGDSFADAGSVANTFARANGLPPAFSLSLFPGAPFTEGRFTEGMNVVQMTEDALALPVRSERFDQPLVNAFELERGSSGNRRISETVTLSNASVFVPKAIAGEGVGMVVVKFYEQVTNNSYPRCVSVCRYWKSWASREETDFNLWKCSRRVIGGDELEIGSFTVTISPFVKSLTHEFLYYQAPLAPSA